jgi:hypothetical protein
MGNEKEVEQQRNCVNLLVKLIPALEGREDNPIRKKFCLKKV